MIGKGFLFFPSFLSLFITRKILSERKERGRKRKGKKEKEEKLEAGLIQVIVRSKKKESVSVDCFRLTMSREASKAEQNIHASDEDGVKMMIGRR